MIASIPAGPNPRRAVGTRSAGPSGGSAAPPGDGKNLLGSADIFNNAQSVPFYLGSSRRGSFQQVSDEPLRSHIFNLKSAI
jgi:hypothetical protein